MFGVFTTTLLAIIVVQVVYFCIKRRNEYKFLAKHGFKGPKPDFIFGNFLQLKKNRTEVMSEWIKKYGKVFGYYSGDFPYVVVSDLDMLKTIFIKDYQNFIDRPRFTVDVEPYRSSLLCLHGDKWKKVRSALSPSFTAQKMRLMSGIMHECVETFVELIKEHARNDQTFDMVQKAQGLSLDVISKCALAMNVDCQRSESELLKQVQVFFKNAETEAMDISVALPFTRPLFKALYYVMESGGMIKGIMDNLQYVISMRRSGNVSKQADILQLMLDAQSKGEKLDDEQLMANAFIFLVAGFETTATALSFITQILVDHPEVQEKILKEMEQHYPGRSDLSYEELGSLTYLDQVIDESLRLYPPVVLFITRYCNKDCTVNGQFFPKGCNILAPVYQIHRDPELYPDPLKFDPERFSPANKGKMHPAQYMPFGLGPRICIGMRFAILEIKFALVKLLKEVRLTPGDGFSSPPPLEIPTVIINPKNGIPVKAVLKSE